MNFIYVIHLMCWNYLILLITQNRHRNNRSNSRDWDNKGGRARSARPPLLSQSLLLFLFLLCVIRSMRSIRSIRYSSTSGG